MKILDNKQLDQKLERLAYQILENNLNEKKLIFLGINNNGLRFAELLRSTFTKLTNMESRLGNISLNAAKPLADEVIIDIDMKDLTKAAIIVVDDVANT